MKSAPNVEAIISKAEKEMDDDSESIITNERYEYIASIIGSCLKKKHAGADTISDKIDRIVTNRILALPIFAVIMFLVYYISMTTIGAAEQAGQMIICSVMASLSAATAVMVMLMKLMQVLWKL